MLAGVTEVFSVCREKAAIWRPFPFLTTGQWWEYHARAWRPGHVSLRGVSAELNE